VVVQDAVQAVFGDRVDVVAEYDQPIHSPSTTMKLRAWCAAVLYRAAAPSGLQPVEPVLRDQFRCQYCGQRFKSEQLTFDHLVPRSRAVPHATWRDHLYWNVELEPT